MCGKFTRRIVWRDAVYLSELFGIPLSPEGAIETVTPMRFAKVVARDGNGSRRSVPMRWGIPRYAADAAKGPMHIHARAETVDTLPTFRDAFANRRGLLIVSTFNEGKEITPTKTEQHVLTPRDGKHIAIPVIWERTEQHAGEATLLTFAMITVAANALIGTITDRMPALLDDSDWAKWLGEEAASIAELKAMLKPSDREMTMEKAGKPAPPKPRKVSGQAALF
jgi:putative SOS response-associated peptidase YedK